MKNTLKNNWPFIVVMCTALLVGCGPVTEETTVTTTDSSNSSSTSGSLDLLSGSAIVSQRDVIGTTDECGTQGGVEISWGNDTDESGALETSEIVQTVVVCHGATGATGVAGADGADGKNTHFEIANATTSDCPAGGKIITIGTKENDGFLAGSTQSFKSCNGVDGTDSDDKIAQGKALVINTREALNSLINEDIYQAYFDTLETTFIDQDAKVVYQVLGDLAVVALDAVSDSGVINDASAEIAVEVLLVENGFSDTDVTVTLVNNILSINDYSAPEVGVTSASISLKHGVQSTSGDNSTESFVITDYLIESSVFTLAPSVSAESSIELVLASGSSSIEAFRTDPSSATLRVNDDSKLSISLEGVNLTSSQGTDFSFVGDLLMSMDLYSGLLDNRVTAIDLNAIALKGKLSNDGKHFGVEVTVDLSDKANGYIDPTMISDDLYNEIYTKLDNYLNAVPELPVAFSTFSQAGRTGVKLVLDYQGLLNDFASAIAADQDPDENVYSLVEDYDRIEITGLPQSLTSQYGDYDITTVYFKDNKIVKQEDTTRYYSSETSLYYGLLIFGDSQVQLEASWYGYEVSVELARDLSQFGYYTSVDVFTSLTTIPFRKGYYRSVYGMIEETKDDLLQIDEIVAKIDSDVDGVFDLTLTLADLHEVSNIYGTITETFAQTSMLLNHDKGSIVANLVLNIESGFQSNGYIYPKGVRYQYTNCDNYSDFKFCLSDTYLAEADVDDMDISFTDMQGAKLMVQFQERVQNEPFSAYVTVDGVGIGKLVRLLSGDYAIEFRDYQRVTLIEN